MKIARTSRAFRTSLFASAALGLFATVPAYAQDNEEAEVSETAPPVSVVGRPVRTEVEISPQIVIANPGTSVTSRDPVNVNGVGQMVADIGGGFVGLCTATLINPRTVIFAAHCVNDAAANAYGNTTGGIPIGFGFSNDNLAATRTWYLPGANRGKTNAAGYFYNANRVYYHPGSLEPNAAQFLYSDIAMASLDTPATNVPTWAMLFSQLPEVPITANGTGYHVTITGYGNNGNATTGSTGGIDYRRRVAENIVGALASIDDFESFLFGPSSGLPQNLYWIDFDDPRRGTGLAPDPRDFNAWRDNPLPNEGITASGDSGGPLILDRTYAKKLVIGVLSGGYTRFFNGAPPNGYGTAAFYQPLYLYWDWIAANNPYRYVSSLAGNGNWTDPTHWVTTTDPNYNIIDSNGNLVNGVPNSPGTGNSDTPGYGQACFEGAANGGFSDCYDVSTGTYTVTVRPIGTAGSGNASTAESVGSASNGAALVSAETLTGDALSNDAAIVQAQVFSQQPDDASATAQAGGGNTAQALPPATIANGLPGATNFVPNNTDGDRFLNLPSRYFDVTLGATGTTTLNTGVTIDRLTIAGAGAALDITSTGALSVLTEINQITGSVNVNGQISSVGDYFMMSGGLSGSGVVKAPFFTSAAGTIAPGTPNGGVGTLTFRGNVILASGSTLMIDLKPGGVSDRVVVESTSTPGSGIANVGGRIVFGYDASIRGGTRYTILNASTAVTGAFQTPSAISAILIPKLFYSTKAVEVLIDTALYRSFAAPGTAAYGIAQLLDQNRPKAAQFDAIYGPLDLQNAATVTATLNSLAPASETTVQSIGIAAVDRIGSFFRDRTADLDPSDMGGQVAHYGAPIQLASVNMGGMSSIGFGSTVRSDAVPQYTTEGALPETMSAFIAGGYLTGNAAPALGTIATGRDDFDGWYAAGGIETSLNADSAIGAAISYTHVKGEASFAGQTATGNAILGTLYGKTGLGKLTLDAQFSAGVFNAKTARAISFLGTPYTLRSTDNALVVNGEVGLSAPIDGKILKVTPRLAGRASQIGFTPTAETGGPVALQYNRDVVKSLQGRLGISVEGKSASFKPFFNGTVIHEFEDRPGYVGANFVNGVAGNAAFFTNVTDRNYAEVSGGLKLTTGNVDISVSAETTVLRKDLESQAYRGSISIRF